MHEGKTEKIKKIRRPLLDTYQGRQLIRLHIYNRVKDSGKFSVFKNRLRITREIYGNIERKFINEDVDLINKEISTEIDRCLDDPSYVSLT